MGSDSSTMLSTDTPQDFAGIAFVTILSIIMLSAIFILYNLNVEGDYKTLTYKIIFGLLTLAIIAILVWSSIDNPFYRMVRTVHDKNSNFDAYNNKRISANLNVEQVIRKDGNTNVVKCKSECDSNDQCYAWMLINKDDPTYLISPGCIHFNDKLGEFVVEESDGYLSGMGETSQVAQNKKQNVENSKNILYISGNEQTDEISKPDVDSESSCFDRCIQTDDCKIWSFIPNVEDGADGICKLYRGNVEGGSQWVATVSETYANNIDFKTEEEFDTLKSGLQTASDGAHVEEAKTYTFGNKEGLYRAASTYSAGQCNNICATDEKCKAWSLNADGRCSLYDSADNLDRTKGAEDSDNYAFIMGGKT